MTRALPNWLTRLPFLERLRSILGRVGLALLVLVQGDASLGRETSRDPDFLPSGTAADAPFGFVELCHRDPSLCLLGQVTASPLPLSGAPSTLAGAARAGQASAIQQSATGIKHGSSRSPRALLNRINTDVNRHVMQQADLQSTGAVEIWRRPPHDRPVGDCEDIAIEKRIRLQEAGFPPDRLFYAVVYRSHLGLHTILVVRLEEGDYVLDSLTSRIIRWRDVPYKWLRQQVPGSPQIWQRIGPAASG